MNLQEKSFIESQVANKAKQPMIAYVLWFFFGSLGGHRFYFGKTGSAIGMIALTLLTAWFTFGIPTLIWVIVDAFLIPGWVEADRTRVRREAENEVQLMQGSHS
ncbi:TM2 domain-containing protein [Staphylococcus simulans]|uniref:TM2 domain-containing protein n=1 Tax=Staphylococcus simulans TaxID=1286 RepID=UPI000D1F69E8|nr:TM2 domain-containing protein [Staphylococcus simulans]MDY5060411.1 TM2 domain-containing protein [Staphylococcus simulans]PTJ14919.1 TM2 domain-containing protein [Staphylococcus simulans]RIN76591.1 TM2 domain-containing protein [Staphylococcus simulans]